MWWKHSVGGRAALLFSAFLVAVACGTEPVEERSLPPASSVPNVPDKRPLVARGGAGSGADAAVSTTDAAGSSRDPKGTALDRTSSDYDGSGGEPAVLELPPGWTPASLTPAAWYVATAADRAVVGPDTFWYEHQRNGRDLKQVNSWAPPLVASSWSAAALTMRFDGAKMMKTDPWSVAPIGTNAGFTVLAVLRSELPQTAGIASWWGDWGDGVWAGLGSTNGLAMLDYRRLDDASMVQLASGNQDLGTGPHVVAWRFSPSTNKVTLMVDGAIAQSRSQPPVGNITSMPLFVGATSPLPTGVFRGDISELVIVNSVVSDENLQYFDEYARNTWSLPAPNLTGTCVKFDGTHSPTTIRCDDGNPATVGDHCSAGSCVGTVPAPGSPQELAPVAWYHAGDAEVLVSTNGVMTWYDRSPQQRDLLNGYWGFPAMVGDGWPGNKPTIRFSGGNALKRNGWTGHPAGLENAFTVLAVLKDTATTPQTTGVVGWWNPNSYGQAATKIKLAGSLTALNLFRRDDFNTQEYLGSTNVGNAPHAVAWRYENGIAKLTVDGTTQTQTNATIGPWPPEWFLMGLGGGFDNTLFKGDISELAVIPRSISDAELGRFNIYAQGEWGGFTLCTRSCPGNVAGGADGCGGTCALCTPNAPCSAECPCTSGRPCTDHTDCAQGLACWQNSGRHFDLRADIGVCAEPHCKINHIEGGCGDVSSACGRCYPPPRTCTSDSQCVAGEVCGTNNGSRFDLDPTARVCWPPVCNVPATTTTYCGTPDSPCGRCDCSANCANKHCGDDPSDGCYGVCNSFCDNGQVGCKQDLECPTGSICGIGAGPLFGKPVGTNVCMPAICARTDPQQPNCGTGGAQCGTCPPRDLTTLCQGKQCSQDGACGTCPTTQGCNGEGVCISMLRDVPAGLPAPLGEASTTPVGGTSGDFSVTDRGGASYSIPIEVPPGRLGMQPDLKLSYLSGKRDGIMSTGWRIDGLSVIARCPKIVALDGRAEPVTYWADDEYCLDGKRLVEIAYGQYRTEVESFKRITAIGPQHPGPEGLPNHYYIGPKGFKVEEPDGRILTYGVSRTASVYAAGVKRIWALEKIEDRAHNTISIQYLTQESRFNVKPRSGTDFGALTSFGHTFETHDSNVAFDSGELVPERISYGGSDTTTLPLPHDRWVSFQYVPRNDPHEQFSWGAVGYATQRLVAIETHVGERAVRRYELDYPPDRPPFQEPLLEGITECAVSASGAKVCKAPTRFTYKNSVGFEPEVSFDFEFPGGAGALDPADEYRILDANGDGRDDILRTRHVMFGTHGAMQLLVSVPGNAREYQAVAGPPCQFESGHPVSQSFVVDLDRDGRDEFQCRPGATRYEYQGTAGWTALQVPLPSFTEQPGSIDESGAGDFNGDGLKDLYHCMRYANGTSADTFSLFVQLARQDGTVEVLSHEGTTTSCGNHDAAGQLPIMDYDGDGSDDIVSRENIHGDIPPVWTIIHQRLGSGVELERVESDVSKEVAERIKAGTNTENLFSFPGPNIRILDINGDGLRDIAWPNFSRGGVFIDVNTGRGFQQRRVNITHNGVATGYMPMPLQWTDRVVDYDGDGNEDLLSPRGSPTDHWHNLFRAAPRMGMQLVMLNSNDPILGARVPADPQNALRSHAEHLAADIDGDGDRDVVSIRAGSATPSSSKFVYQLALGRANRLLTKVAEGLGRVVEIDYSPIRVGSEGEIDPVYSVGSCTSSTDDSAPGYDCVKKVPNLVSSHRVRDGNTSALQDQFFYRYEGARAGLKGRGPYGFMSRFVEHRTALGALISDTRVDFNADTFELAGRPKLKTVQYPVVFEHPVAGPAGPFGRFARVVTTSYDWELVAAKAPGGRFPILRHMVTQELNGDQPIVTLEKTLDTVTDLGNVEKETKRTLIHRLAVGPGAGTSREVGRTVMNATFDVREADWLLRLPLRQAVTDSREGHGQTRTTGFTHYPNGLVQTVIREPDRPAYTQFVTFDRTARGSIYATTVRGADPAGPQRREETGFDRLEILPVSRKNAKGQVTVLHFDQLHGGLLSGSDLNGLTTQRAYDGFGRLRRVLTPVDDVEILYAGGESFNSPIGAHAASLSVTTRVKDGPMTVESFDAFGRLRQTIQNGLKGTFVAEEYAYDWNGRVTQQSAAHLLTDLTTQGFTRYDYDSIGRLTKETYPDGSATEHVHGVPLGIRPLADVPDGSAASLVATVHPKGTLTLTQFDYQGDIVSVTEGASLSIINNPPPAGEATFTKYAYGAFGTLLRVTDAMGKVTTIQSDDLGRKERVTDPGTTTGPMLYRYTPFDELEYFTDGRGRVEKYEYDALSRMTAIRDGSNVLIAEYKYDEPGVPNSLGRLSSMWRRRSPETTEGNRVRIAYEAGSRGRLASITREIAGEASPLVTAFTYDPQKPSRLASTQYPAAAGQAFSVTHEYDGVGNLEALRSNAGEIYWQLVDADQGIRIKTEAFGNLVENRREYYRLGMNAPECQTSTLESCMPGRLRDLTTVRPSGTGAESLRDRSYRYDRNGNMSSRTVRISASVVTGDTFAYDAFDRLTARRRIGTGANDVESEYDLRYDSVGNITRRTDIPFVGSPSDSNYTYDTTNRDRVMQAGSASYQYDGNGSQIVRTNPGGGITSQALDYDDLTVPWRITTTRSSGTIATVLEYDADGERVAKRSPSETTLYAGDDYQRTTSAGVTKHRYRIYAAGREVVNVVKTETSGTVTSSALQYLHDDLLGSVELVTGAGGVVSEDRERFKAFGEGPASLGVSTGARVGYTGHEHDSELGLVNMRGRLFDPKLQRFTAVDPYVTNPFDGQGLNRYAYVQNNPMTFVDPSGFQQKAPEPPSWAFKGAANPQEAVLRWNMWQNRLAQEMGLEKPAQKTEAANPASPETSDSSGTAATDGDSSADSASTGSGDPGANVTGGNGTPRSGGNEPTGETGGPPSDYFRTSQQGGSSRGPDGPLSGSGQGGGGGSTSEWIAARTAGGFVPFVGSILTMADPGATDEEKGEALVEILVDAATLGAGAPLKAVLGIKKAKAGIRAAERVEGGLKKGKSLTTKQAVERLRNKKDVHTGDSKKLARQLQKKAQRGKPIDEGAHDKGYFDHIHGHDRAGGHAYHGGPK